MMFDPSTGKLIECKLEFKDILVILSPIKDYKVCDDIDKIKVSRNALPIVISAILGTLLSIYGSYFMNDLLLKVDAMYLLLKYGIIALVGIGLTIIQKIICQNVIAKNTGKLLHIYCDKLLHSTLSISRHFSLAQIKRVASEISHYVEFEINKKPMIISSLIMIICSFIILVERTKLLA